MSEHCGLETKCK